MPKSPVKLNFLILLGIFSFFNATVVIQDLLEQENTINGEDGVDFSYGENRWREMRMTHKDRNKQIDDEEKVNSSIDDDDTNDQLYHKVESLSNNTSCPENFSLAMDKILQRSETHHDRSIPRVIHFIIQSRCIPLEVNNNLLQWSNLNKDYSIIFHDQAHIDEFLSHDRADIPYIANAKKFAIDPIAKYDLARFMILWEYGGIVADIKTVPGLLFGNGTIIGERDECILEYRNALDRRVNPDGLIACSQKHLILYFLIEYSIASFHLMLSESGDNRTYASKREDIFSFAASQQYVGRNTEGRLKNQKALRGKVQGIAKKHGLVVIDPEAAEGETATTVALSQKSKDAIKLVPESRKKILNFTRDGDHDIDVDIESLLQIVKNESEASCPEGLFWVGDTYNKDSIILKGRKIPKIIHVTTKSRCMTKTYAENIKNWLFDGYSLFIHDDSAVRRLLDQDFPEFPLLHNAKQCLSSGGKSVIFHFILFLGIYLNVLTNKTAGLADLWRYVALWKYGGIYTDADNAPGDLFNEGRIITEEMDSVFERELGGFPSQYFFASSPGSPGKFVEYFAHFFLPRY